MTREEALKIIEVIEKRYITLDNEERQALIVATKALEQEPKTGKWIDGLIAKVLEEVDGGTDDNYIRYTDICDRVTKSIRDYCEANMESEEA